MAKKNGIGICVIRVLLVNLCTTNKLTECPMPIRKVNTLFSEIHKFFSGKSSDDAISCLTQTLRCLSLREKTLFGKVTRFNALYPLEWVLSMLIIFPCLLIKNPLGYTKSSFGRLCGASKDVFYRFMNDDSLDWRKIMSHITGQLWRRMSVRADHGDSPVCLIVDDTDYPKRGIRMENIGRVFSHVANMMILGYKVLTLAISDGKSQMTLDFELVGEPGKKGMHSLSEADFNARFSKERDGECPSAKRMANYTRSKIELLIEMVGRAIGNGCRFDYLLADSWFTCREVIRYIWTRRIKCHYLGMMKMGSKSMRFSFAPNGEKVSSSAIIAKRSTKKSGMRYSRQRRCNYIVVDAYLDDIPVRIFYVRSSKRAPWCAIITTDTSLDFIRAYKIYSMRWAIEVIYKDCKQNLGLGKCQSRNFTAQIAHTTIAFLQYNALSVSRRFSEYETVGGLFRDACDDAIEISVCERIWQIICEVAGQIAEAFDIGNDRAMEIIIKDSDKLTHIFNYCQRLSAA